MFKETNTSVLENPEKETQQQIKKIMEIKDSIYDLDDIAKVDYFLKKIIAHSEKIKEKYKDNRLEYIRNNYYNILIGSTTEESRQNIDFEGNLSVIKFFNDLEKEIKQERERK